VENGPAAHADSALIFSPSLTFDSTPTMTNYSQTNICEISDPEFQLMVDELCHCVDLGKDQYESQPLSFLLMTIGREKRAMTKEHLPGNGILTRKVNKLPIDSVVHCVCTELANLKRTHIESFDGKTVLSLIKNCYQVYCPLPTRPKKSTRRQNAYQFKTQLIERRRKNGDL